MKKSSFVVIVLVLLVAIPFYISVWTWSDTDLAHKWLYTGMVAIGHLIGSLIFVCCNECG